MHITSAVNLPKTWGLYPLCAFTSICPGAVIPCYWHWNTTDWIPAWTHVPAIHGEEKQAAPVIFAHPWLLWHIVIKLNSFTNKSKGRGACVVWCGERKSQQLTRGRAQSCHQSASGRSAHTWAALDGVHEVRAATQPSPSCLNHGVT